MFILTEDGEGNLGTCSAFCFILSSEEEAPVVQW